MGFTEAVKSVFSKYATFSGRATRSEFWFFYLFNFLVCWVGYLVPGILGAIFNGAEGFAAGIGIGLVLVWIYAIAAIIPNLAVTVRRLHDSGKSGWYWWFCIIPIVGPIILLIFLVQGSDGDNQYGSVPE